MELFSRSYCDFRQLACVLAIATLLIGCASTSKPTDAPNPAINAPSASAVVTDIGQSVQGRPIKATSIGAGEMIVLIIASIHGDEPAGTPLLDRLAGHLRGEPELVQNRTVILVPRANPDGLEHHRRTNMNGVDLNRNFPADNFRDSSRHGEEPLSEPESRALHDLVLLVQPQRVISIHQPIACIDYDGPGRALAEAMAAACDLPVRRLGSRPGSLGSWVGNTLGVPIITLELPAGAHRLDDDELWDRYAAMLIAAIRHE